MNHKGKIGNIIKDDHISRVKKLLKKKTISCEGVMWGRKYNIEIINIRKYLNQWSYRDNDKYCYEVDVKVNTELLDISPWYWDRNKRRMNGRVRTWKNEKNLLEELVFFGIDNICISKVQYV